METIKDKIKNILFQKKEIPTKMTGSEFEKVIEKNPSWCLRLTAPLEITTYAHLINSKITHLSPLITFSGGDKGWAANFSKCKNLKVATGKFEGIVNFENSGVEKIENLTVDANITSKGVASFRYCKNLKVASGTYSGHVNFSDTGVETIKDLIITSGFLGIKASILNCPVKYASKEYRSREYSLDTGIIKTSIKKDKEDKIKKTIKEIKEEANNIIL